MAGLLQTARVMMRLPSPTPTITCLLAALLCAGCGPDGPAPDVLHTGGCHGQAAVADGRVFWIDNCAKQLRSISVEGGASDIRATDERFYRAILRQPLVKDAAALYWVSSQPDTVSAGERVDLHRVSIASGEVQTLYRGEKELKGLALAGGYLYWVSWELPYRVLRGPAHGQSAPEVIVSSDDVIEGPWASEDAVYYSVRRPTEALDADATFYRLPLAGGPPVEVGRAEPAWIERVAVYSGSLYWTASPTASGQPPNTYWLHVLGPEGQESTAVQLPTRPAALTVDGSGVLVHTSETTASMWSQETRQRMERYSYDLSEKVLLATWVDSQPSYGVVSHESRAFWSVGYQLLSADLSP